MKTSQGFVFSRCFVSHQVEEQVFCSALRALAVILTIIINIIEIASAVCILQQRLFDSFAFTANISLTHVHDLFSENIEPWGLSGLFLFCCQASSVFERFVYAQFTHATRAKSIAIRMSLNANTACLLSCINFLSKHSTSSPATSDRIQENSTPF